ncbi:MAG: hypothetical protein WCO21_00160 [bacterium]|nr:hypothetical protein [Candidatus Jorgensenbacteria bacterium]
MFNPFSLIKKQPDMNDPKMLKDFLVQLGKLSPTERLYIKKMIGNHLKQKISRDQVEGAFGEIESKFKNDLTPDELATLKKELIELIS